MEEPSHTQTRICREAEDKVLGCAAPTAKPNAPGHSMSLEKHRRTLDSHRNEVIESVSRVALSKGAHTTKGTKSDCWALVDGCPLAMPGLGLVQRQVSPSHL